MTKKDDQKLIDLANAGLNATDQYDEKDLPALRAVAYYAFWEGAEAGGHYTDDMWRQKKRLREPKSPWGTTVPEADMYESGARPDLDK